MDYEQKYKEALERAKKWYFAPNSETMPTYAKRIIKEIFPEFKESEDERIRKELIEHCEQQAEIFNTLSTANDYAKVQSWIAWLDPKHDYRHCENNVDENNAPKEYGKSEDEETRKEIIEFIKSSFPVGKNNRWITWLEKQGEQKPVDMLKNYFKNTSKEQLEKDFEELKVYNNFGISITNVKPKFKVGDCVIKKHNSNINDFGYFTITDITGGKYWYNDRVICDISEQDEWELYEPTRQRPISGSKDFEETLVDIIVSSQGLYDYDAIKDVVKRETPILLATLKQKPATFDSDENEMVKKELITFVRGLLECHDKPNAERDEKYVSWIAWLENQGEKKPDDKAESKFKVGDWIVDNEDDEFFKVTKVRENTYCIASIDGEEFDIQKDIVEDDYHILSIDDTKDGDVLACESGWTCIFKALINDYTFSSYCFMDADKLVCETGSECHTLDKAFVDAYNGEIHPATKEQRDKLKKAILNAGYKWDSEKKELKKIEQKPYGQREECEKCQFNFAGECKGYCELKRNEQKSVEWSEDDERIRTCLIKDQEKALEDVKNDKYGHGEIISDLKEMYRERITWLESLRPQPKQEWSNELMMILDEVIRNPHLSTTEYNGLIDLKEKLTYVEPKPTDFSNIRTWKYVVDAVLAEEHGIGYYLGSPWITETADKLMKRFGTIEHKSAEWSEEDEKAIGIIKSALKHPYDMDGKWDRQFALDWLESLKPNRIKL